MKTIDDLKALFPTIIDQIASRDHDMIDCQEKTTNYYTYEDDGWLIEISYDCYAEWEYEPGDYWTAPYSEILSACGKDVEIYACYTDLETGEEVDFNEEDTMELKKGIEEVLEDIA